MKKVAQAIVIAAVLLLLLAMFSRRMARAAASVSWDETAGTGSGDVIVVSQSVTETLDRFEDYDFDFPGWPDLPPAPDYFPDHITCPSHPTLQSLTFPPTLGLPDMPTLTLMSYITDVVSPIVGLTEAIMNWDTIIDSSLVMPSGIAEAAGFGIDDFGDDGGSPDMDISIAGYTASGLAAELVSGMDAMLSYLRGVEEIGVIGPTVAALVVGISWITFIALVKIVLKPLMLAVHLVLEIWRLLPFT